MSSNSPVVIVTGCSKGGIGFALCEEFAAKGCKVYATARRLEAMEGFTREGIERLKLDVTDDANVEDVVRTVLDQEGRIDVLVNNAAAPCIAPLAEMPLDRVKNIFDTNVFAVLRTVKAVFPHMASRKRGVIVNVGSTAGDIPTPWNGLYSATKASMRSVSESLYMECAPFGIHVVHLNPGGIRSNIANNIRSSFDLPDGSLYKPFLDPMIKLIDMSQNGAMPSEEFARRVVKAALRQKPPRYMSMGAASGIFAFFMWLPRTFVLWLLWKILVGKVDVDSA